ncbi:hypothetical protein GJ496_003019 [Pomphorhynchus laevis]|nr:hypothetical protein GJ496_003019 [Pomphorhynchus laevis]
MIDLDSTDIDDLKDDIGELKMSILLTLYAKYGGSKDILLPIDQLPSLFKELGIYIPIEQITEYALIALNNENRINFYNLLTMERYFRIKFQRYLRTMFKSGDIRDSRERWIFFRIISRFALMHDKSGYGYISLTDIAKSIYPISRTIIVDQTDRDENLEYLMNLLRTKVSSYPDLIKIKDFIDCIQAIVDYE